MIYHAYDAYEQMLAPLRWLAEEAAYHFAQPWPGMPESGWPASWPASLSVMAQTRLTHARPEFGIDRVMIGNRGDDRQS
jgi:poly(3-hydroxybutyrate) depolymerase